MPTFGFFQDPTLNFEWALAYYFDLNFFPHSGREKEKELRIMSLSLEFFLGKMEQLTISPLFRHLLWPVFFLSIHFVN